ncbi:hypothetical protein DFH07DRAFT_1056413 [Mycena maculata]|uniref:NmrA-like domain-containing protein n=1 Tax=Mycena maculata TaxID=230809 RepID=A0AAD7K3Q8_9AGAR|nr:hypothetical protein DFH07DRAFT_1056413 [Mycena maculata]
MASRIVSVFGATGLQGSAIIKGLLKDGMFVPRAITRNPDTEAAQKLKVSGVEVVRGDMVDKASLVNALRGSEAVFAVTVPMFRQADGEGPNEVVQGKNMVDAAREVGVKFFIFSAPPPADSVSTTIHASAAGSALPYDSETSMDTSSETLFEYPSYSSLPPPVPSKPEIPVLPTGSTAEKIDVILQMLRKAKLSVTDILLASLEKPTYVSPFYTAPPKAPNSFNAPRSAAQRILDAMYKDERGRRTIRAWFDPYTTDLVCEKISSQADEMVKALSTHKNVAEMKPEWLRQWSLTTTVANAANEKAPDLLSILRSALNTDKALEKNKKKSNDTACYTIVGQIVTRRSQYAPDFAAPMGLMWWANGCSREAMEILCNIGLSKSFDTNQKLIGSTANYCIQDARDVAHGPDGCMFNYDNFNLSHSIFIEQNPNPAALDLSAILMRAQNAPDLDFNADLCPSLQQSYAAHHQFCSYVIRVLCRYQNKLHSRQDEPALQSPPERRLPDDYVTENFPLKLSTKDESSVRGNLSVHVDTHIKQLGLPYDQLVKAVLSINDQATQALNRSAKAIRAFDINPFLRAQIFQLGIGLFHLCLNLIWAILNVHRGHINHHGSLSHLFSIIDKTRLGGRHPDYHSLLSALMQILDGLLLDAWRIECGYRTLDEYAASNPSASDLRTKAAAILYNHGTPTRNPLNPSDTSDSDTVRENTRRLIHDLMYVCEVSRAISDGDFGRVENILTTLGMMFRGAGSKNYSTEIMHFTHNMKKVWRGNGFDELVRDNMIVKMTKTKNRCQGVDANIEHHIGRVKELFAAKGIYGGWERLADISAAIDVIDSVKKNIAMSMDASYSGSSHRTPDTSSLVWRIANKAKELKLNSLDVSRDSTHVGKASIDILSTGEAVLKSASLATFNKNRRALLKGIQVEEEVDDLPPMDLSLEHPQEEDGN